MNDGKAQEYRERKTYDIANSVLTHTGPVETCEKADDTATDALLPDGVYVFASPTCPNCRIACAYMDKAGFQYEKLMAEENAELAKQYGVKQAPTLIVTDGVNFEKFAGAGAIKQYVS